MAEYLINRKLKSIREKMNLTVHDISYDTGISADELIKIETDRKKISSKELRVLCDYYGIDIDSFIYESSHYDDIKGIVLAGGTGTRLYPITEGVSKQLLPVYNKPMIYYPLSILMSSGIKDILIITTKEDQKGFKRLLGDGSKFGIKLNYIIQPSPDGLAQAFILGEDFIGDKCSAMILGDNIFYGSGLKEELKNARYNALNGYATIFGYQVKDPERFGIMELDKDNNVLSVEEKPQFPKSDYAITGLYFYPKYVSKNAKTVKPSHRGELEITSLNDIYLKGQKLKAVLLNEGYTWFDTGTFDSLIDASNMVRSIEDNRDRLICSPEVIAYNNGWLSYDKALKRAELLGKNSYGTLLKRVLERK